tara:strand:+ start:39132 stop:42140 length:3009 start_codon:yes stop_codon:yes gene_type:complete
MIKKLRLQNILILLVVCTFSLSARSAENLFFLGNELEALRTDVQKSGTVSGTVSEASTGDELIGANVLIKGTLKGTSVDVEGKFSIRNVEAGSQVLVVSYLGFQTREIPIEVLEGENIEITVELEPQGYEGEEVTITAQARGQVAAINQQLSSNTISNIVSKDRIEELPDVNAAESIGRLPGVSIQRSGGEASKIVVRGLSPKFSNVTVNGVRVPSTDTNDRSVDLALISSNMLDGIEVTKALTPDKDADALGGTVDLKLRNASEGLSGNLQILGGYTALQETYGNYRIAASLSNRFLDNNLGVILNLNTDRYDRSADSFSGSYERVTFGSNEGDIPYTQQIRLTENNIERSRLGGSVILDYKIPKGKVVFNGVYNKLKNDGLRRGNNLIFEGAQKHQEYTLTKGFNETDIFTSALSIEQDFGRLLYDVTLASTSSNSESPRDYNWVFWEEGAGSFNSTNSPDTLSPQALPSMFNNLLSNTNLFSLSESSRKTQEDEISAQANIRVNFELGDAISGYVKGGFKFRSLDRSNDQTEIGTGNTPYYGGGRNFRQAIANSLPQFNLDPENRLPIEPFLSDYSRDNFVGGNYSLGYTVDPDLMLLINEIAKENLAYVNYSGRGSLGSDYVGTEDYSAFYLMSELEIGQYITFMPGFRYEGEETSYTAKYYDRNDPAVGSAAPLESYVYKDTTATRSGDFLLPMVHLQVKPLEWLNLRLAYTQSISRPNFNQYAPITYYSPLSQYANAPNENLRSSKSTNLDASLSVYQNKVGFFTVSVFQKEIEDYISFIQFRAVPGQTIIPDLNIEAAGNNVFTVNTVINNPNIATVKGIELDWQTNFWYLPSLLKGLVLNINYTKLTSEIANPAFIVEQVPIEPRPIRPPFSTQVLRDTSTVSTLPDQPDDILNLTLGYDYKGFSGRFSIFYQLGTNTGRGGDPFLGWDDTFNDDYYRIDVSLRQNIFEGFQVYANLNNLNSESDLSYQSSKYRYPTNEQLYGFTMDVGFKYEF